ncbi:MAG: RHS repeat-associated core domain-containing protein [Fibrella sp.]|nr:RHS repeat-associated core domain-containing protein [Armatimonadota bacterium]
MAGIAYPSAATNAFVYNGLDQCIGKTDSTGTFSYSLADDSIDSDVLSDGAATYPFGNGLSGEVRARSYHADALGTTRATSDSTGAASSTLETDAFGNTWQPGTTGGQTPFGFAGQHGYQSDVDSGLARLGHRYYNVSTGRFLSRDPIQDGRNWYIYCQNDPLNVVDPEGLKPKKGIQAGHVSNGSDFAVTIVGDIDDGHGGSQIVIIVLPPEYETNTNKIDADYILLKDQTWSHLSPIFFGDNTVRNNKNDTGPTVTGPKSKDIQPPNGKENEYPAIMGPNPTRPVKKLTEKEAMGLKSIGPIVDPTGY